MFDVQNGDKRVAHYARARIDVTLLREHVLRTHIGQDAVVVDLTPEGVAELNRAAGSDSHPIFIVTLGRELVGTGLYVIGGPAIYITAGTKIDRLVAALPSTK